MATRTQSLIQKIKSPITAAGDAHAELMKKINKLISEAGDAKNFEFFTAALKEKKYGEALRKACDHEHPEKVFSVVEALLTSRLINIDTIKEKVEGFTCRDYAVKHKHEPLINLLDQYLGHVVAKKTAASRH